MTRPPEATRQTVIDRAGGRCEVCRRTDLGPLHHRRLKGMGGTSVAWSDDPSNLLAVCPRCHDHIHANPAESYDRGLIVRRGDEPWAVPAVLWCGRVWLSDVYQTRQEAS